MRAALTLAVVAGLFSATACEKGEAPATNPAQEAAPTPASPSVEAEPEPAEPAEPEAPPAGASGEDESEPKAEPGQLVVSKDPCQTDEDCVRASCCHATECVAKSNAPKCDAAVCTMDCREGTMDCGGGCLCHEGFCAAQLAGPITPPN